MTYTLFTEHPVRRVFLCVIVINSIETTMEEIGGCARTGLIDKRPKEKYHSYKGEVGKIVDNVIILRKSIFFLKN